MLLSKGDVVLVPFPFTDLSQTKLRPAIVLYSDDKFRDATLCFISSQKLDNLDRCEFLIEFGSPDFEMTGLKVSSKVRVTRVVTLDQRLLKRRLGKLSKHLLYILNQTMIVAFQLSTE